MPLYTLNEYGEVLLYAPGVGVMPVSSLEHVLATTTFDDGLEIRTRFLGMAFDPVVPDPPLLFEVVNRYVNEPSHLEAHLLPTWRQAHGVHGELVRLWAMQGHTIVQNFFPDVPKPCSVEDLMPKTPVPSLWDRLLED